MRLDTLLKELLGCWGGGAFLATLSTVAGASQLFLYTLNKEATASFNFLHELCEEDEDEEYLEEAIRSFLKKRWAMIQGTDADYVSFPYSPINQLCLKLAQKIVKPDEPLLKVLVPTLEIDYYFLALDNLRGLTEREVDGQRDIDFSKFIISEDCKKIIPIYPWFEAQASNTGEFFNHLYTVDDELVPLTDNEISRLEHSAGTHSFDFFDEFALRKKLINAQGTLAEAVLKLCDGLKANGHHAIGTLERAHDNVFDVIREFALTLATLTEPDRNEIMALTNPNWDSFGYHWNVISGFDGRNRDHTAETCVEENERALRSILDEYPDKFAAIRLVQENVNEEPPAPITPFSRLLGLIQRTLEARKTALEKFAEQEDLYSVREAWKFYYLDTPEIIERRLQAYEFHLLYGKEEGEDEIILNRLGDLEYAHKVIAPEALDTLLQNQDENDLRVIFAQAMEAESFCAEFLISKTYFTPPENVLHQALEKGFDSLIFAYLKTGRPIDYGLNTELHSPLYLAVQYEAMDVIVELIQAGADLSEPYCSDALGILPLLLYAYQEEWSAVLDALFQRNDLSVNDADNSGWTTLHYAVYYGDPTFVSRLLERGASPNLMNGDDETPVHLAARYDDIYCLQLLIAKNADLNIKNYRGESPLAVAIWKGHESCAIALVEAGANFKDVGILGLALYKPQRGLICACIDKDPELRGIPQEDLSRILQDFLQSHYPRVMQPYINRLVLAGATVANLPDFFQHRLVAMNFRELMNHPDCDRLKDLHGFEGLCQFCRLEPTSADALKLYAATVEKGLRKRGQEGAEAISMALRSGSLQALCLALQNFRTDLPERLNGLVQSYLIPPESAVSRKRTYTEFA